MEITGRLTANAVVRTVSDEKKVVGFSLAINDSYRSKGEVKRITTFVECSYWLNTGIAEYLRKGNLVQLYGRIGVNAYNGHDGVAKASLTFNTSEIKLLGAASAKNSESGNSIADAEPSESEKVTPSLDKGDDDLPF